VARLYALVGRTAGQASAMLELGEELVDMHEANIAALTAKRAPARRGAKS
jgi:hypothetical protein